MEPPVGHQTTAKQDAALEWAASFIASAYFIWTLLRMHHLGAVMTNTYVGLGVELPLPTRVVIGLQPVVLPMIFIILAVFVLLKELLPMEKRWTLAITVLSVLIVSIAADAIQTSYLLPLQELMEKLSK